MYKKISALFSRLIEAAISDQKRKRVLFILINTLVGIVSLAMTVVNHFTGERVLFCFTLSFAAICAVNIIVIRHTQIKESRIHIAFCIEALALIGFFIVSGIPDGFSVLWICLIPSFAFLIFSSRLAFVFCACALAMLLFFFWAPVGRALLMYDYSETFLFRFPLFYTAVYFIAFITESIRRETQHQLEKSREEYYHLYRHDSLTGLYNRFGINEFLENAVNARSTESITLLIMDIDDFKTVNDTYGHECADLVLKAVSNILLERMCEHSRFCRWGGEEFLMVMMCGHDPMEIAETVRKAVADTPVHYNGSDIRITVSIGVSTTSSAEHLTVHKMIEQADRALYQSKAAGKNRVTLYR